MALPDLKAKAAAFFGGDDPMRQFALKWAGIFGLIVIVALGGFVALLSAASSVKDRIVQAQAKVQALNQLNVTSANMQTMLGEIRTNAEIEASQFVNGDDIPVTLQTLSQAATANQVILKKINSLTPEDIKDFSMKRIPIRLEIEGEYANIGTFLAGAKLTAKRFFTIEEARFTSDQAHSGRITADVRLVFYSRT